MFRFVFVASKIVSFIFLISFIFSFGWVFFLFPQSCDGFVQFLFRNFLSYHLLFLCFSSFLNVSSSKVDFYAYTQNCKFFFTLTILVLFNFIFFVMVYCLSNHFSFFSTSITQFFLVFLTDHYSFIHLIWNLKKNRDLLFRH